jgi:hypothetical protein
MKDFKRFYARFIVTARDFRPALISPTPQQQTQQRRKLEVAVSWQ